MLLSGGIICLPFLIITTLSSANPGSASVGTLSLEQAVQLALSQQTYLEIQQEELRRLEGQLLETGGTFDWKLFGQIRHGYQRIPLTKSERSAQRELSPDTPEIGDYRSDLTEYRAGITRQFRTGVSADVAVELERRDNLVIDDAPGVARGRIVFGINIPLLRGLGASSTAGFEKAARLELESGSHAVVHAASEVVVEASVAFWNALAAEQAVVLRRESLERAGALQESIRKLVEADEIPPSSIGQAEAHLSERRAEFLEAQAAAFAARSELGLALGFDPGYLATTPVPRGAFPDPVNMDEETTRYPLWLRFATDHRRDLKRFRMLEESAAALRDQAMSGIKSRLDFRLEADYAKVEEGASSSAYLTPFRSRQTGPGVFAVLDWELPVENREARGRYLQQQSLHRQSTLNTLGLVRSIGSRVASRFNTLASNHHQITYYTRTASFYEQALRDEEKKFQMGMATLLDVVQTQERLTQALLALLETRRRYAENLVLLRFELGDLVHSDVASLEVDTNRLVQPPQLSRDFQTSGPDPAVNPPNYPIP